MKQTSIRWEEVRRRVQSSENSLGQALSESPERIEAVYRQRALQLAKADDGNRLTPGTPALIFRLVQERYAIQLKDMAEVRPFEGCTAVPGASPDFLGVISVRGELRPLINLARVLSAATSAETGSVLILRRHAALKVDAVEDLREIRSEELSRSAQGRYLQAIASGTVGMLDIEAMLSAVLGPKESRPL